MPNFLSHLTKSGQARLLEELNYMNLEEIRGFCSERGIPYRDRGRVRDSGRQVSKPHPSQERPESGVLANRIEFECGRDENQRAVPFVEGAVQPVEEGLEISKTEMDEGDPHRGHVAVLGPRQKFPEMFFRAVAVFRAAEDIAKHAYVVHQPASQLDRLPELRDCPVVLPPLRADITERIVREGERRLQREDPFELLRGAIEIVVEIVDVSDLRFQLEVQRVQSLGLLELDEGLVVPPFEKREPPRIPEMRRRRTRAELEGTGERLLRSPSIPVVVHGNQGANLVRIGEGRVELQGFLDGPSSLRHTVGR